MADVDEIFDYVMNTPDNTNPAILRGMLNSLAGSSSGGAGVWWVTMTYDDETSTWTADKSFSEIVAAVQAGENVLARTTYTNVQDEINNIYYVTSFLGPGGDNPDGQVSFSSIPGVGVRGVSCSYLYHVSGTTWETGFYEYPQS